MLRSACLLGCVALGLAPATASAWCQSLSIPDENMLVCPRRCRMVSDFSPETREELGIVAIRWEQPCLTWAIDPAGTPDVPFADADAAVARSFARWTGVDCAGVGQNPLELQQVEIDELVCDFVDHTRRGANVNIVTFASDWLARDHESPAFALTTAIFDVSTGEILGADMELNDEFFEWAICPSGGCTDGSVDIENVVVHEAGHFVGLAHAPEGDDATMWACAEAGEVLKRDLAADDIEGWCSLYADLESASCPPVDNDAGAARRCTFIGDSCGEADDPECPSGYCVSFDGARECTVPCSDDPEVCPGSHECQVVNGQAVCAPVGGGCSCRVAGDGTGPNGFGLLVGALVGLAFAIRVRRRRR